jgi:hypothetical protein
MVWDTNTDIITYNSKYKNAYHLIELMKSKKSLKLD